MNIMSETGETAGTLYRPGSDVTGLTDLASELQVLGAESIDIKPDSQSIVLNFASGKTKPRPYINGPDNKCLEGSVWFLPSCKPPGSTATQSDAEIKGDLFTIDPTDGSVSRIENTIYQAHEPGKVSLHNLCLEGRIMFGGDFVGVTQVNSPQTPGLIYLKGAEFATRKYLNPNRPTYQTSLNTPTTPTNSSGSPNDKRSSGADTKSSKPERRRIRSQRPSVASSRKAADHAIDYSNNPDHPGSLFQHLQEHVLKTMYGLGASDEKKAASQSRQARMYVDSESRSHPNDTHTGEEGTRIEHHSHDQAVLSQSEIEKHKKGENMFKDWVVEQYRKQSQD